MKARRISKFAQIRLRKAELGAFECLKKSPKTYNGVNGVATFSQLFLTGFFFALTGNDDIHKSLDDFKIRPDLTRVYRVSCT